MKAILSTTYDDQYLFCLPIVTWAWNKLGVDVICFMPNFNQCPDVRKAELVAAKCPLFTRWEFFNCPPEKAATYAQVSRLFACCLNLPEDEVLVTSDVDMLVFKKPPMGGGTSNAGLFTEDEKQVKFATVFGADLVPEGQMPMCYVTAKVRDWRKLMGTKGRTYQECLDEQLAPLEAEQFRGNFWSRDQELMWRAVNKKLYHLGTWENSVSTVLVERARPGTQFATNRIDRDDSFWEERLNDQVIDAHLWRPLYEEANFAKLMKLMTYFWPQEDFTWLVDYREQYVKLL